MPPRKIRKTSETTDSDSEKVVTLNDESDEFCFHCHKDTRHSECIFCSQCPLMFHRKCLKLSTMKKNDVVCPQCKIIHRAKVSSSNEYGHEKIDKEVLQMMLLIIFRNNVDHERFQSETDAVKVKQELSPFIFSPMTLGMIEDRIKSGYYEFSEQVIRDIKQLKHNWLIFDPSKEKFLKGEIEKFYNEIYFFEACVFCYQNKFTLKNYFDKPCERIHLLIWAKKSKYPYWPSKVMSVASLNSKKELNIRFFGDHEYSWVPESNCFLFSAKDPNSAKDLASLDNETKKGYEDAIREKDKYIDNLRRMYGFQYAPFKTKFEMARLQSHLEFMLPGLKQSRALENEEARIEKKKSHVERWTSVLKRFSIAETDEKKHSEKSDFEVVDQPFDTTTETNENKTSYHLSQSQNVDNLDMNGRINRVPSRTLSTSSSEFLKQISLSPQPLNKSSLGRVVTTSQNLNRYSTLSNSTLPKDDKVDNLPSADDSVSSLIARIQQNHQDRETELLEEIDCLKRTHDGQLKLAQLEQQRAVKETKKKTWCANCHDEAKIYCCFNTSYCQPQCQTIHWQLIHKNFCSNKK